MISLSSSSSSSSASLLSPIQSLLSLSYFCHILKFSILISEIDNNLVVANSEYFNIGTKNVTISERFPSPNDFLYDDDYLLSATVHDGAKSEEYRSLKRLPKLFSFYTDEDDIKVEFEFKVPFIDIPVKRSANTLKDYAKGLVNINLPAVLLSGLIVIGGIGVGKLFQPHNYINPISSFHIGKESKSSDTKNFNFDSESLPFKLKYKNSKGHSSDVGLINLVEDIEYMLQDKNIDVISCVQKFICSRIRTIYDGIKAGDSTSTNKIVDGLLSSQLLLNYIKDTAIMEAIDIGKIGYDCIAKYKNCRWSLTSFDTLIDSYIKNLE